MIFLPDKFIPNFIRNSWKMRVLIGIFLTLIIISIVYLEIKQWELDLVRGPDLYDEMDLPITHELLDSVAVGLQKYHDQFGYYPQIEGKYFFDSIKKYQNISDVYVYADSITSKGDTIVVKKHLKDRLFAYKSISHTYLGVGIPALRIIYMRITPDSFLLYSVGKNLIDERGKGDDIVYK
jgi:hypothetical protein